VELYFHSLITPSSLSAQFKKHRDTFTFTFTFTFTTDTHRAAPEFVRCFFKFIWEYLFSSFSFFEMKMSGLVRLPCPLCVSLSVFEPMY
jgi:hypothetical protein